MRSPFVLPAGVGCVLLAIFSKRNEFVCMENLTSTEIAQYRSALSALSEAMVALDIIEDCEGDVEDAAISIALQVGQEPNQSDQWLEGLAKRWRVAICRGEEGNSPEESAVRSAIAAGNLAEATEKFVAASTLPTRLAIPVLICVLQMGIENFCRPLDESLRTME